MFAPLMEDYHFEQITLESREAIHERFKEWEFRNSEFTFSNLFLWQPNCKTSYAIVDDVLLVRYICRRGDDGEFLLPPLPSASNRDFKHALNVAMDYFRSENKKFNLRIVTPQIREYIEDAMPGRFSFEHERDNDDYVYLAESLSTLSGKKLHSKRNHINKFLSLYEYEYEVYDPKKHADECMELNKAWHEYKDDESQELMSSENDAVSRSLRFSKELGLSGAVIRINGKVEAFSIGEQISPDTALIHMEKANSEIPGLYPLINQQFVLNRWSDMKYINREEDMGLEGLRKAKLSYHPEFLIEKYRARLI